MHGHLLTIIGAAACAGAPQLAAAQGEPVELFDGSFAGWSIENAPGGNISIRDGVLRVEAPAGWLRSEQTYADFRLRIEFRFVTDDADSGIFIRTVADSSFGPGWPSNGYQLQLRNPVIESRFPAVGGFFRHGTPPGDTEFDPAVAAAASSGTGIWQLLEIAVEGERLEARLNGTLLTRAAGIANPTGFIGIQAETGAVEFRSIGIELLR
jgi:Domain of Unknown Function (DUF1080)